MQQINFYVLKKNRWFGNGALQIGLKTQCSVSDSLIFCKKYDTLKSAEYALNVFKENNVLPMYKGEWKIKEYKISEV